MRRFAVLWAALAVACLSATPAWKLVLKDGTAVDCDGTPVVVNGIYMFRTIDGLDASLSADQVDREKTDIANKVAPPPRQWRLIGQTVHEPSRGVSAVNDANFDAEVLGSKTPVLVEFWAAWCGYCKKMEPTIQSVAGDYGDRLKVYKVDIDKYPAIAKRYGVHALPTLMLFNHGQQTGTIRGAADKSTVTRILAGHL